MSATNPALIADLVSGILAIRLAADAPLPNEQKIGALLDRLLRSCSRQA